MKMTTLPLIMTQSLSLYFLLLWLTKAQTPASKRKEPFQLWVTCLRCHPALVLLGKLVHLGKLVLLGNSRKLTLLMRRLSPPLI